MGKILTCTQLVFWAISLELLLECAGEAKGRTELWLLGAMFSFLAFVGGTLVLRLFWYEWQGYLLRTNGEMSNE